MAIDKKTVEYVAHLARLELTQAELERLSSQLRSIVGFIDKLSELEVKNISPTSHILPINNILREDVPRGSLSSDKVLENAPQKEGEFFAVPRVIE